jgi:tRNA(Arg) A34 adenosine deaminase TadA
MQDDFELKISRQVERLKTGSARAIEREVAEKRIAWYRRNHPASAGRGGASPRQGYDLIFREYMGLSEAELPILAESDAEIVWKSQNRCQTLEACGALGLDTRKVCRGMFEKSTQALLSCLDPQLRFLRSYETIRPYAGHCEERIVKVDFAAMMRLAIGEARLSRGEGNKGYGAVVALGDRIIGQAHDMAITAKDPSLHAEVNAIRQAVRELGDPDLSGAVLFSSCEPCPMCSSLAVWANLSTIVYGMSIQDTARLGKARILVGSEQIVNNSPVMIEIIGGVLQDECAPLYT